MPRRRFEDDDDEYDDRPRSRKAAGGFPWATALIVVGGLAALAIVTCGVLGFVFVKRTERMVEQVRADEMRMEAEAREQEAAQRVVAAGAGGEAVEPMPPGVPPQPPATKFDVGGGWWVILFRSDDPALWNTGPRAGEDFALPLKYAPEGTKFLRLRRMDTGAAIIIPIARQNLRKAAPQGATVRWNGEAKDEHGGVHLGIAEGKTLPWLDEAGKGKVSVLMDGWDANLGSGFGHGHHVDNGGQKYAWDGKEIPKTAFEIAVTAAELTPAEEKLLRTPDRP